VGVAKSATPFGDVVPSVMSEVAIGDLGAERQTESDSRVSGVSPHATTWRSGSHMLGGVDSGWGGASAYLQRTEQIVEVDVQRL
jgi:hypothetical protein